MSKRRTRKQKETAQHTYRLGSWYTKENLQPSMKAVSTGVLESGKTRQITAVNLYGYEPHFIRQDLIRTTIITSLILVLEIGLFMFWR
jgi:hypothetical protein